ncbi:MAG: UDP-glucose/GDP-mannose dehydrogenase family protein [Eubacteriales bacterium]
MARLCVVGLGYVGLVTASCFASLGHRVTGLDKDQKKINLLSGGISTFFEPGLDELLKNGLKKGVLSFTDDFKTAVSQAEIIFICVGTPAHENGMAEMSQVEEVSRCIACNINDYKLIVEKSTVPAGTAERIRRTIKMSSQNAGASFDVASNPEFLKEGSAVSDFMYPDRIVLGTDNDRAKGKLRELYQDFNCPIMFTDIPTAELIKHASNAFLAMKISFINLVADICEKAGANIKQVAYGLGYDKRIGREFLNAGAGYGGSCFPKDLKAFSAMADALGINTALLKEVDCINEKRVFKIVEKIEEALWVCKNKNIAVLGLAFKNNTDDVRESPGIKLIKELINRGSIVSCYDPKAMDNARSELGGTKGPVTFAESPYDAARMTDAAVFMTEWPEFIRIDFQKLRETMRTPVIIDARNMLVPDEVVKYGFLYNGIGYYRHTQRKISCGF